MATAVRLYTADEVLRMGQLSADGRNDVRRELIRGELREMPPAGAEHGERAAEIAYLLKDFVKKNRLTGKVYGAETGFILAKSPDTMRAHDAAYMSIDRLTGGRSPEGYILGAPDLSVEVMSPGDTIAETKEKAEMFMAAGTVLVWVVNPRRQTVMVLAPDREPMLLGPDDTLTGDPVLPGFSIRVGDLFT
jgi:Uma2 family endonuclease